MWLGSLRICGTLKRGEKICTPLVYDLATSSVTFSEHVIHMNLILDQATNDGIAFKLVKWKYTQTEMVL